MSSTIFVISEQLCCHLFMSSIICALAINSLHVGLRHTSSLEHWDKVVFSHKKKKSHFQNLSFTSLCINSNLRIIDLEMSGWIYSLPETRAGELPLSTPIVCVNPCGSSRRLIQCVRGRGWRETCTTTQTETQGPLLWLRAFSGKERRVWRC